MTGEGSRFCHAMLAIPMQIIVYRSKAHVLKIRFVNCVFVIRVSVNDNGSVKSAK
ncbi:hypothetical protein BCh11DRAFT_00855 [Burkholderia sp. Ch1-1]|uniref:Uncharacterized protein n=1 Tax=Paraburkholderia dioscoreae TaxID=2604047 RepID=A0A5Q4ZSB5_9BURK|nr:hypothetical protein BCh11DRAFT_00855 [Burkholderia sp. Ch1-1]VVD31910.1 conserved protein of unknown function [Paraburkholderia dioscoreae]